MTPPDNNNDNRKNSLGFLWFAIIAFALMLAVWLTLFILAATHPVEEIPLKKTVAQTASVARAASPCDGAAAPPSGMGCPPMPAPAAT